MASRTCFILFALAYSAWSFRVKKTPTHVSSTEQHDSSPEPREATLVSPTHAQAPGAQEADSGCSDVVPGSQAAKDNGSGLGCKCRRTYSISGTDDACSALFGETDFDPDALNGKGCTCASMLERLGISKGLDGLFGGMTDDYAANVGKLDSWLSDVKTKGATRAGELEESFTEAQEGVAQNIAKLKGKFSKASNEEKAEIKAQMDNLQVKLRDVRKAIGGVVNEGVKKAKDSAYQVYASLKAEMDKESVDGRDDIMDSARKLKSRFFEMRASAISEMPSRQSLEVSTELIADSMGTLREERKAHVLNLVAKLEIDSKLESLQEQRGLLKSAAINKGKEIGAGVGRFVEVTAGNIGALRENLKTAAADAKPAIEAKIAERLAQLEAFQAASLEQQADLRAKLTKVIGSLGEDIGQHKERLADAKFWEKPAMENEIEKFENRLAQLRTDGFDKQAKVEARLAMLASGVSESIGELQLWVQGEADDKKKSFIQYAIDNKKSLLIGLKASTAKKQQALKSSADAFKTIMVGHIASLEEKLKTASTDQANKHMLNMELEEFRWLLVRLQLTNDNFKEDANDMISELYNDWMSAMEVFGAGDTKTRLSETLSFLGSQTARVAEDASAVASDTAAVLAEWVGQAKAVSGGNIQDIGTIAMSYLEQITVGSAQQGAKVEALLRDAEETLSTLGGQLRGSFKAEKDQKHSHHMNWFPVPEKGEEAIEEHFKSAQDVLIQVREVVANLKTAQETELNDVTHTLGESMGALKEQLASASGGQAEYIELTIEGLETDLGILKTTLGEMRAVLEAQLADVVGTVSEQIGEFKEKLAEASDDQSKDTYKEHIAKLEVRMTDLRSAAMDTSGDGKTAFAKASDLISTRLGALQAKLEMQEKAFLKDDQAKTQVLLETAEENFEQIDEARKSLIGQVQEQVDGLARQVAATHGALALRLAEITKAGISAGENASAYQGDLASFQDALKLLRTDMTKNARGQLKRVYKKMHDRLESRKADLKRATNDTAANIKEDIANQTAKMERLATAFSNRKAAAHAVVDNLVTRITEYVAEFQQTAAGATESADLQTLLDALKQAALDKTTKAEETLRTVVDKFREKHLALKTAAAEKAASYDTAAYADTFSEWMDNLQSAVDDEGIADVVGAAVTSEVMLSIQVKLELYGSPSSLLQLNNDVSLTDDPGLMEKFESWMTQLWDVVEKRSVEANCDDTVCAAEQVDVSDTPTGNNTDDKSGVDRTSLCFVAISTVLSVLSTAV